MMANSPNNFENIIKNIEEGAYFTEEDLVVEDPSLSLRAILSQESPTITIPYMPHAGQIPFHCSEKPVRLLACGRRWGKSEAAIAELLSFCFGKNKTKKPPKCWVISPSYQQGRPIHNKFLEMCPRSLIKSQSKQDKWYQFINGATVQFKSENQDLVGEGLNLIIVDEAARLSRTKIEEELIPTLLDREGVMIAVTTPRGKNWFYDLYMEYKEGANDIDAWKEPSWLNPHLSWEKIKWSFKRMRNRLTFRQEICAEFLEDVNSVFANVKKQSFGDPLYEPAFGRDYVFGIDFGRHDARTALIVMDVEAKRAVSIALLEEREWKYQMKLLEVYYKKWRPKKIYVDMATIGDKITEDLQKEGYEVVGVKMNVPSTRNSIIEDLAISIEMGEVSYPDYRKHQEWEVLINELQAYEFNILANRIVYQAPKGHFCDTIMALGLALYGIKDLEREAKRFIPFTRPYRL